MRRLYIYSEHYYLNRRLSAEGVKMRRVLFVITVLILILTACSPAESAATEDLSYPNEPSYPGESPTSIPVGLTPAQLAAVTSLSETLNLPFDQITLVSTEAVTWPDGCLGIVRVGELCTQAEVPGFKIILEANGQEYEFHTNQDGSFVLLAEGGQTSSDVEETVVKQLATNLGLPESDITVVSSDETEFGDACLGVAMEDVMCAQVVTPGRIIVLEANSIQYEYHISEDGSRVQPATLALIWRREGGIAGFCDSLTVFRSGEVYTNSCNSQAEGTVGTLADLLSSRERQQFSDWMAEFGEATLDASDPEGVADRMVVTLDFLGTGSKPLPESEQQVLLNFGQALYQKLTQ